MKQNKDEQIRELKDSLSRRDDIWIMVFIVASILIFMFGVFVGQRNTDYARGLENELIECREGVPLGMEGQDNYTFNYECWDSWDERKIEGSYTFSSYNLYKKAFDDIEDSGSYRSCEVIE